MQARAATKGSRLYHTCAISNHVIKSVMKRLEENPHRSPCTGPSQSMRIFVRVINDIFTLSLDSSGEILYKRGIKTHRAKAPLRETMASGALIMAGYDGTGPLIDPMCGAGTFSLEAAMISSRIPPGWYRSFAFMDWPAFRPCQWAYLRKQEEIDFRSEPDGPLIFASDINPQACAMLVETLETVGLARGVRVKRADFFDLSPKTVSGTAGTVALNPPYGRRIGSLKESDALFHDVCRKLKSDYKGWRLALITPRKHLIKKIPFRVKIHPIHHGGLHVYLLTGMI
jgi:putative N6-adenine-specific DNA methylase